MKFDTSTIKKQITAVKFLSKTTKNNCRIVINILLKNSDIENIRALLYPRPNCIIRIFGASYIRTRSV